MRAAVWSVCYSGTGILCRGSGRITSWSVCIAQGAPSLGLDQKVVCVGGANSRNKSLLWRSRKIPAQPSFRRPIFSSSDFACIFLASTYRVKSSAFTAHVGWSNLCVLVNTVPPAERRHNCRAMLRQTTTFLSRARPSARKRGYCRTGPIVRIVRGRLPGNRKVTV